MPAPASEPIIRLVDIRKSYQMGDVLSQVLQESDALSFMPLVQTDSAGGVIVTDWYVNPNSPGERMKLTVSILDQDLRADALRVAASRQVLQDGQWVAASTRAATVQKLEGIILTKARDLRRSAIAD